MISRANLEYIHDSAAAYAGLNVDIDKEFIIESRLMPLARSMGISSANELIRMMQQGTIPNSAQLLSENLADTETYFFRDIRPFETLRQIVLPSLIEKRASEKRLAIWCPGGSTGQEPYSLALLIHEYFPDLLSWNLEISTCDLSLEAAEAGASGAYNQIEVNRGLPSALLVKYFKREGLVWRIKEEVRTQVQFSRINLAERWPPTSKFDIILLRNVLSGILPELQTEILRRTQRRLAPDGFLLLGPKETPNGIAESFDAVQFDKVTCYNPKPLPPGEEEEGEDGDEVAPWEKATTPWIKLALLATGFGQVDAEKATAAFSDDADMSQRVIFAGNQDTASAAEPPHASLQEAFTSVPKEQLLAVALIDPLRKAISDTFMAMLSSGAESAGPEELKNEWDTQVVSTIKFSGFAKGRICIRLEPEVAQSLSGEILGLAPEDIGPEELTQMIGQLADIAAGNFETALKAANLTITREPQVTAEGNASLLELSPKVFHEPSALTYEGSGFRASVIINAFKSK